MLSKQKLCGALKEVNRLYNKALLKKNTRMIRKWSSERTRLLKLMLNYGNNTDG